MCVFLGLAQYSGDPRIEWHLNAYSSKDAVLDAVKNLPYKGGNTLTGATFQKFYIYIYTYIFFFLWYHPSIVSVSRPRLDLHPGELLQAWSRLTPGRPQDRDPHHRREIPGWRDTSCRKPEELRSGAVCYRWGRTHAGALVSSRVKKTFRCAITASPLRRRLSPQAFRFEFVRLSHSRDCDVSGTPRGLSAYTDSDRVKDQRSSWQHIFRWNTRIIMTNVLTGTFLTGSTELITLNCVSNSKLCWPSRFFARPAAKCVTWPSFTNCGSESLVWRLQLLGCADSASV